MFSPLLFGTLFKASLALALQESIKSSTENCPWLNSLILSVLVVKLADNCLIIGCEINVKASSNLFPDLNIETNISTVLLSIPNDFNIGFETSSKTPAKTLAISSHINLLSWLYNPLKLVLFSPSIFTVLSKTSL